MNNIEIPDLYLRGSFNGWGLDSPLEKISVDKFTASIYLSKEIYSFNIADEQTSKEWTFSLANNDANAISLNDKVTLKKVQGIENTIQFSADKSGLFLVTVEFSANQVILSIAEDQNAQLDSIERDAANFLLAEHKKSKQYLSSKVAEYLDVEHLFGSLSITETEPFDYVFGDNVDGYYEGKTKSLNENNKYRHHQGWLFGDFVSFVDGQENDKLQALNASLLPYGIEHKYANKSKDILSLFSGERTICLSALVDQSAKLALAPQLNICLKNTLVEVCNNSVVYSLDSKASLSGTPKFIVLSANTAVHFQEDLSTDSIYIETQNFEKELNLYLSFTYTKEEAIALSESALHEDKLIAHKQKIYDFLTGNYLWTSDLEYNRAVMWARLASRTFVNTEFGTGIWAGLPWFKDCWGRDTFIALSGTSIINGFYSEAKQIILDFASMQMSEQDSRNYGRVPNRITSKTNIIYNTTDGTPWLIREVLEYLNYTGDTSFAQDVYPIVKRYIQGVEKNYLDADGLMSHRDPDTWMDAKIEGKVPWSPRGNRANDIQALWYTSLIAAIELAKLLKDDKNKAHWQQLAIKAKASFNALFWNDAGKVLADHVSESGTPNYENRPNQLMTLTIPMDQSFVAAEIGAQIVKNAVNQLLFPWGICSLAQSDVNFHPYHDNQDNYHKDAAYHNGTIWGWNAGFTVGALTLYGQQDFAYKLSKNLAKQILHMGHRGTMSENLDAYQPDQKNLVQTGTYAQAWSVSEFSRNAQQNYLGFKPELLFKRLTLAPAIPDAWQEFKANIPFGDDQSIFIKYSRVAERAIFNITANSQTNLEVYFKLHDKQGNLRAVSFNLQKVNNVSFDYATNKLVLNDAALDFAIERLFAPVLDKLSFATPNLDLAHKSMQQQNYLWNKIMAKPVVLAKD